MKLIEQIFGKRNNIRVLRHLIMHKDWEFNISELSKDTGINKGVISRLIKQLEKDNLIKVNKKGKIILFRINKENLIIKELIIPIFKSEKDFFDLYIKPDILKLKSKNTESVLLYGSYSRGEFTLTSDIDLMVILKRKDNTTIKAVTEKFLEKDVILNTDIISLKEFRKLYKMKEPLFIKIEQNHKVLVGKSFNKIIE